MNAQTHLEKELEEDLLNFAVDQAMDVSQGIYQDALDLAEAIGENKILLGDAYVAFRELRERLDEAKYD